MAFETPTNYTPTPNTTRPALVDHLQGIDAALGASTGTTNLAYTTALTTGTVTSSTGTNATIPAAVGGTSAGLMVAGDKTKVDFISVTQVVDLDAMETDIADHQAALGIADGDQNFGTFTGTTIPDNQTGKQAIQSLETALEAATGTTNLGYTAAPTQGIVTSDTGTDATIPAADATNAGLILPAEKTKVGFLTITQAVDADALESDVADLTTLSGVASNATDFGTFTGTTLTDNLALKPLLQEIETAVEGIPSRIQTVVADITARDALAGSTTGDLVFVTDASADATVTAGGAMYIWNGAAWVKVAEAESLDVVTNLAVANVTATNLDVTSSTGTDATLPAATNAAAGVATAAQIADLEDVVTLTGIAGNSTTFGTSLTGNVVTDNQDLLNVLIQLEAAHEIGAATDAQLAAATDARNTTGKFAGKRYRVTDRNDTIVFSQGTGATAKWVSADGLYENTPA